MKDEGKILAKTSKGDSMLTVDESDKGDQFLTSDQLTLNKPKIENEDNSERASWDYNSDNEERKGLLTANSYKSSSSVQNVLKENKSGNIRASNNNSYPNRTQSKSDLSSKKEIKYKNLSSEMLELHRSLEDLTKETLIEKLNDKLKSHLKPATIAEINKLRSAQENSP